MSWVKTVGAELLGLFVDDGRFAVAILLWLLVAGFALKRMDLSGGVGAAILFAGLVLILIENAIRSARGR
jgi:hypothetical protein